VEENVMASFDSIVADAREKFNLGDKASALLAALLALITDKNRGGFAGFLDRIDAAGLSDVSSSWISSGASAPLSREQAEAALGPVTLDEISGQTGLDYETTIAASAYMLPRVVNELTPDGAVPAETEIIAHLPETSETITESFDRIGTAAVAMVDEKGDIAVEDFDEKDSNLKWLLPLIILILLVIFGFLFCSTSPKV
jgi:uncharacterized protein YidB (DUF937 family)